MDDYVSDFFAKVRSELSQINQSKAALDARRKVLESYLSFEMDFSTPAKTETKSSLFRPNLEGRNKVLTALRGCALWPREIADVTGFSLSVTTGLISGLKKNGLIETNDAGKWRITSETKSDYGKYIAKAPTNPQERRILDALSKLGTMSPTQIKNAIGATALQAICARLNDLRHKGLVQHVAHGRWAPA